MFSVFCFDSCVNIEDVSRDCQYWILIAVCLTPKKKNTHALISNSNLKQKKPFFSHLILILRDHKFYATVVRDRHAVQI